MICAVYHLHPRYERSGDHMRKVEDCDANRRHWKFLGAPRHHCGTSLFMVAVTLPPGRKSNPCLRSLQQ
jgi:hypothetical protein